MRSSQVRLKLDRYTRGDKEQAGMKIRIDEMVSAPGHPLRRSIPPSSPNTRFERRTTGEHVVSTAAWQHVLADLRARFVRSN